MQETNDEVLMKQTMLVSGCYIDVATQGQRFPMMRDTKLEIEIR